MKMTTKPILISGGGIASLLLAQSLRRSNIPYRIFERDTSFTFRAQGYRLRLSQEGLDAIEEVLDGDGWRAFWDACGKTGGVGFARYDAISGELIESTAPIALTSRGGQALGIARGDMRRLFAQGCEDSIEWSRVVRSYEKTDDGVRAIFSDGTRSEEGSMLIAGEGIYSRVAKQLSGGKLKVYDTGAKGIHGQALTTAFNGLDEGVYQLRDGARGPGKGAFLITNVRSGDRDDPSIKFGWTMGGEPGVIRPPSGDLAIVGKPAADIAKEIARDWHPRFKPMIDQMDENEAAFWRITCSTPSGVPEWENDPRVTVIGDAAHSMTPAGGIGANTAVRDSALLGRLLREAGGYKEGVTAAYEKEMRVYGSEAVNISYTLAASQFGISIDEEKTPTV